MTWAERVSNEKILKEMITKRALIHRIRNSQLKFIRPTREEGLENFPSKGILRAVEGSGTPT